MITRRDFLNLSRLAAAALFVNPIQFSLFPPDEEDFHLVGRARVAVSLIYRYAQPSLRSDRIGVLRRDQIISIFEEINSPDGPAHNPRWYRLSKGFVHSGRLQRVDGAHPVNPPLASIPENGQLGEVCVPYTQSFRKMQAGDWVKLYRLYYQSVHWITGIESGPKGIVYYRLTDDLLHVHHLVPAVHVRPVAIEELSPISPLVHPDHKRIQVSIDEQSLTAFEGEQMVRNASVSTGIPTDPVPGLLPTETPRGRFRVQTKMPSRHMGEGTLTNDIEAYELPGVPWVCFFHKDGIALHGTYWHDNFGRMMSHGCINLRNEDALWLYRWTTPTASPQDWYTRGLGTLIEIV
jgi:hypothetical protein